MSSHELTSLWGWSPAHGPGLGTCGQAKAQRHPPQACPGPVATRTPPWTCHPPCRILASELWALLEMMLGWLITEKLKYLDFILQTRILLSMNFVLF